MKLSRRSFVGGALAAPFIAQPGFGQAKGSVLRVIPHADLKNIDPIWTTAYISRNHGYWSTTRCSRWTKTSSPSRRWSTSGRPRPTARPTPSCCATASPGMTASR